MAGLAMLDIDGMSKDIPEGAYHVIGEIITAWSALDRLFLEMLIEEMNMDKGLAGILIGRMDTRGKYDRLIAVHNYKDQPSEMKVLRALRKRINRLQSRRNDLAHGDLIGTHTKSKELLFLVTQYSRESDSLEPIFHVNGYSMRALKDNLRQIRALVTIFRDMAE